MLSEELIGIDVEPVTRWMVNHVGDLAPPFEFRLVAAGGSNLTYEVTDQNGRRVALRRPPTTAVLASAHDMSREWRIIEALSRHDIGVPVPAALGFCDDASVTGASFYVMGFADGLILRTGSQAGEIGISTDSARAATESLNDVHVRMHLCDPDAIGLGDLGRPNAYVERQLARWRKQYESAKVRELPLLVDLHERLGRSVPKEQRPGGLAHGDYRFDNTVIDPKTQAVVAVLDWELCTRGEPIADFCWSMMYWADPGDPYVMLSDCPTLHPSFMRRDEYVAMYAAKSGLDLSQRDWYMAFTWWKQAALVEGVYARRLKGARGGMAVDDVHGIADKVDLMLELSASLAAAEGI